MSQIYEFMDQAFLEAGIRDASRAAMPFLPNTRVGDRILVKNVPYLNKLSVQVFVTANEEGIFFRVFYPRNGTLDIETKWSWKNIIYANYEEKGRNRFYLQVETMEKKIDLVCIEVNQERKKSLLKFLNQNFDENGHNKGLFYPGDSSEKKDLLGSDESRIVDEKVFLNKQKRRKIKTAVIKIRSILAIIVVTLMLAYIIGKGVFHLF